MIEFKLSNIFQKIIDLIYQINKFVESEHQFIINITKKILEHIKFVIKKYIQKFNESDKSINHQHVRVKFQTFSLQFLSD